MFFCTPRNSITIMKYRQARGKQAAQRGSEKSFGVVFVISR
jgi:hypothetical protein